MYLFLDLDFFIKNIYIFISILQSVLIYNLSLSHDIFLDFRTCFWIFNLYGVIAQALYK